MVGAEVCAKMSMSRKATAAVIRHSLRRCSALASGIPGLQRKRRIPSGAPSSFAGDHMEDVYEYRNDTAARSVS